MGWHHKQAANPKPGFCCAQISHALGGQCERRGTVERDGKMFCWQHDPGSPEDREAARKARVAEMLARDAKMEAEFNRRKLEREAGLRDLTDDDLRLIVSLGGIRAMLESK